MSTRDETPRSSPPAPADLDAKIDRIAGLSAQAVVQIDRLARLVAAGHSLDTRSRREVVDVLADNRAVLSQLRDSRNAVAQQIAKDDSGGALVRRRRDDSITASIKLEIGGDHKRISWREVGKTVAKAVLLAAAGALIRHLAGR